MLRPTAPPPAIGLIVGAVAIAAETMLVVLLKRVAPSEAFGTIYLVGVLVVSSVWGLGLSVAVSLASALALAYFRNWPTRGFMPLTLENGVTITIFMVVALCANLVAGLARARAIEAEQRHREADVLARQQAALRRVATLVARGVSQSDVFTAVAEEMARCLGVDNAEVFRYEPDGTTAVVASYAEPGEPHLTVGDHVTIEGDNVAAAVFRTGRAVRMDDYSGASGSLAARLRQMGVRCRVGAPIVVDERVWGIAVIGSSRPEPLPDDIEDRIAEFADLVATAIAAATTRTDLIASRARIVTAADEARRRLERDLHDGAQQRLVSLGLQLRMAEDSIPPEMHDHRQHLSEIASGLTAVSEDLREISRGIHPAILSKGGLSPALKTLARRSAVPVTLDLAIDRRFDDPIEVATYYVVAEALTNAAKHAQASEVTASARSDNKNLYLSIRDDGIGGADPAKGSGLIGLKDRVEAVGGQIEVTSPPGRGTSLQITIPVSGP